jgi:hypothetical protein
LHNASADIHRPKVFAALRLPTGCP